MMNKVLLLLFVLLSISSWQEVLAEDLSWKSLSNDQQYMLSPLKDRWETIPPKRLQKIIRRSKRWGNLPQHKKEKIKQRVKKISQMPPEQRKQYWKKIKKFKTLPAEQQQKIRKLRIWFKSLPQEKMQELRRQWKNLSPEQRERFKSQINYSVFS